MQLLSLALFVDWATFFPTLTLFYFLDPWRPLNYFVGLEFKSKNLNNKKKVWGAGMRENINSRCSAVLAFHGGVVLAFHCVHDKGERLTETGRQDVSKVDFIDLLGLNIDLLQSTCCSQYKFSRSGINVFCTLYRAVKRKSKRAASSLSYP